MISNGDGKTLGTDYDGNGLQTDTIVKDISRSKLGTGGVVAGNLGGAAALTGVAKDDTQLDNDPNLNKIKENDQTNFSVTIDGSSRNYTTSDGVIFLGGKNVVGLIGSISGATAFSDLMEVYNKQDGKIFIYTQDNGSGQYSIGAAGNYMKVVNEGGIYLGIIPTNVTISDTVSGFTGINSNSDSSKNTNYIGMYGIGSKLENKSLITDRATGSTTNNSTGAVGIYGEKINSDGSITNTGTINIGKSGIGIFGNGVSNSNKISIVNTGLITANSGTGIASKWGSIDQKNNNILLQGDKSIGIFAEGSDLVIENTEIKDETVLEATPNPPTNSYGIALRENSLGSTTLTMKDSVKINLSGDNNIGIYGSKISYTDSTTSTTNRLTIGLGVNGIGMYLTDIQGSATNIKTQNITTGGTTSTGTSGGIYATKSSGNISIETGDVTIGSSSISSPSNGTSFGIYVDAPTSNTGSITAGNIYVNQTEGTGIYAKNINNITVGNILSGKNGVYQEANASGTLKTGLITLTGTADDMLGIGVKGSPVAVDITGIKTSNVSGTITSAGNGLIGIYIPNGSLKVGSDGINIKGGDSSTGVYIKDPSLASGSAPTSIVDFGTASSSIDLGNESVGIFLEGQKVSNMMNGSIKVGDSGSTSSDMSTGIYTENVIFDNSITTNVETGKNAIGVYFGKDTKASSGNLIYNGNVKVGEGSTGVYKVGGTLERSASSTMEITGSNASAIGFYLDDSILNLTGSLSATTLKMDSGIAFLLKGNASNVEYNGTIITETDLNSMTGLGADVERMVYSERNQLLTGDITLSSNLRTRGHRAINGRIDLDANIYTSSTNPVTNTYGILVDGRYTPSGATPTPNVEAYLHSGKIIDMTNSTGSIGIQALSGARIQNDGEIKVGGSTATTTGIGMYGNSTSGLATEITNNGKVTLTSDKGVGIVAQNVDLGGKVVNSGTIENSGTQKGTIGIYSSITTGVTPTALGSGVITNSGSIKLGEDSRGIYANNVTITNSGSIKVGDSVNDTAVGIYANAYSVINNSGDMTVGNKGIGYYIENSKLNITGGNFNISDLGILVYGVDSSEINYSSSVGVTSSTASTLADARPIFYLKDSKLDFGSSNPLFTVRKNSIGVYATNSEISGSASYELGENSTGIYSDQPTTTVENKSGSSITSISGSSPNAKGIVVKKGNVKNAGLIDLTGDKTVGIYVEGNGSNTIENTNKIKVNGNEAIGIYSTGISTLTNTNGEVRVGDSLSSSSPSIGIYTDAGTITSTNGIIESGKNSLGIYSANTSSNITINGTYFKVGENGIGIYTSGGTLNIDNASSFDVANNSSLGVYSKNSTTTSGSNMNIGDNSFGYILETGSLTTSGTSTLGSGSVYIYSANGGNISNSGNISTTNPSGE